MNEFKPLDADRLWNEIKAEQQAQAEGRIESNTAAEPVTDSDVEAHNRARRCMGLPELTREDAAAAILQGRANMDAYARSHPFAWGQAVKNAERTRGYSELRRKLDNT